MKKIIKTLLLVSAATSALAFAACGGDDNVIAPVKDGGTADVTQSDTGAGDTGTDTGNQDTGGGDGGTDADAALPIGPIDRMGRPAINTALNFGDDPTKDTYNAENTYQDWAANTKYDTNFNNNLKTFDKLGGKASSWGDAGVHPLRDPLKVDVLFLDTGKTCIVSPYCETGYLEIEAELLLGGPAHTTCGGRTLPEDIIDKTLTLLITKNTATISDGVNAPTKPPTRTFPYLATPN